MKGGNKMSFGTAMFSIKGVQNMYQEFDSKPEEIKKPQQVKPQKAKVEQKKTNINSISKTVAHKVSEKPKLLLKPSQVAVKKPFEQQNKPVQNAIKVPVKLVTAQSIKPPTVLQPVKEQKISLEPLNCLQTSHNTYQLTLNTKPTKWSCQKLIQKNGKPAHQITQSPQITFSFSQRNILQGSIGNCYFICSLAALSTHLELLKRRITNGQKYNNESKYYTVNLFESGKLVTLEVENSFITIYSKPINNDITPLILQKAYAQLYGGYDIMTMGHSIDAFRDLSGNIAEYIDMKDKQQFIKCIIDAFQNNHPMVIASKHQPSNQSISAKHSYNILSYQQQNGQFYLQLRDPRGWTKANFHLPSDLQLNTQNGQFWIGHKDLVMNFQVVTVSRFLDQKESFYYYKTFSGKQLVNNNASKAIYFQVNEKTIVAASIHQKHKKFFDNNYHYSVVNLMLCEVDKTGRLLRTIKTDFNSQQVSSLQISLQKGSYVIIGQIHPFRVNKLKYPQQAFTLSLNTNNPITQKFNLISQFSIQKALTLYIQQNPQQFKQLITKQNLHRYHGSLFGKVCILYQNHSDKNVIEELQFQSENIEVKEKKVTLGKGEVKLMMYPIGAQNNCSHKCAFKSKTFYSK